VGPTTTAVSGWRSLHSDMSNVNNYFYATGLLFIDLHARFACTMRTLPQGKGRTDLWTDLDREISIFRSPCRSDMCLCVCWVFLIGGVFLDRNNVCDLATFRCTLTAFNSGMRQTVIRGCDLAIYLIDIGMSVWEINLPDGRGRLASYPMCRRLLPLRNLYSALQTTWSLHYSD